MGPIPAAYDVSKMPDKHVHKNKILALTAHDMPFVAEELFTKDPEWAITTLMDLYRYVFHFLFSRLLSH